MQKKTQYKSEAPGNIITGSVYNGDFYQVKDWSFDDRGNKISGKGYNDCLCFVLVRSGHFFFDLCHTPYQMHTGTVVIDKPDYEYTLYPAQGQCSIFNFTDELYASIIDEYNLHRVSFFSNKNILAQALSTTPEIDYLHYQALQHTKRSSKLEMDILVMELLRQIIEGVTHRSLDTQRSIPVNKNHLTAIERAKEYMHRHFLEDISLLELSKQCFISPFYFSRLFRNFTGLPPYKYLQEVRLKHAEMLVKNSSLSVTDICYSSGFRNTDYFSAAFTKKFKTSPTRYKSLAR